MKRNLKKFMSFALLLFSTVTFLGLNRGLEAQEKAEILITIERETVWPGSPVYSAEIYSDGTVTYEGKRFVKVVGKKRYSISQSEIGELVKAFEQAGYSSLNFLYRFNEQGMTVSDLPTTTTSIVLNGKEKRVVNYFGAPKKLFELEKTIERLAGLNALIGSPREARETPKPIPGKPFSLP